MNTDVEERRVVKKEKRLKSSDKALVAYSQLSYCEIGERAIVIPLNHWNTLMVENGQPATTSRVISYNEKTGVFETFYSIYFDINKGYKHE